MGTTVTIGVEVEAGVQCKGIPYDLKSTLAPHGGKLSLPLHGEVMTDLGANQVELITPPCANGGQVTECPLALEDALHGFVSEGTMQYLPYISCVSADVSAVLRHPRLSSRVRAQLKALLQEAYPRDVSEQLAGLANACSTHVHVGRVDEYGIAHAFDDEAYRGEGLTLMNLFTNCGPWWARWIAKRAGVEDDLRRQAVWFTFTVPHRMPRKGTWLYTWNEYEQYVRASGPQLVRRVSEEFCVDLVTPRDIADPLTRQTIWDQGRLSRLGTIESRSAMSLSPGFAGVFAHMVQTVSAYTIEYLAGCQAHTSEEVAALYRYLHTRIGDFMPEKPLTEDEWSVLAGLRS